MGTYPETTRQTRARSGVDPARSADPALLHASPGALSRASRNLRRHWLRDVRRVLVLVAADLATYLVLRAAVRALRDGVAGDALGSLVSTLFAQGFLGGPQFAVALLLSLSIAGAYGAGELRRDTGRVLYGAMLAALISLYSVAWREDLLLILVQFGVSVVVVGSAIAGARLVVDAIVTRARSGGGGARTVLVAHQSANWPRLDELMASGSDLRLVATVQLPDRTNAAGDPVLASLADRIEQADADTVLLWTDLDEDEFAHAVDVALASGCRLLAAPHAPGAAGIQPRSVWIDGKALVELTAPSLKAWQLAVKRAVDIVGSSVGLVLLSPVLAVVAAIIALDSKGSAFFRQERIGRGGQPFNVWKFRTMQQGVSDSTHKEFVAKLIAEGNGRRNNHGPDLSDRTVYKLTNDGRVTRVGRWLRLMSLDELPQLVNVLKGEMSIVGPRPPLPYEVQQYDHWQLVRLGVRPGITGLWQVSGRSRLSYREMCELDIEYVQRWSIWMDLKILLKTIPVVLLNTGRAA